jgi:hypothetical protein
MRSMTAEGPKTEVGPLERHFRFTPVYGHGRAALPCPKTFTEAEVVGPFAILPYHPLNRLQPKPRHCQVDARNHRECGNDPHPPWPDGFGPATSQKRSNSAEHGCSECSRRLTDRVPRWLKEESVIRVDNLGDNMMLRRQAGCRPYASISGSF